MAKKKTAKRSVKKATKRRPRRDLVADSITAGSIQAQQLTLVDEKGRPRLWAAWFAEGKDRRGSMRLQFLDKERRPLLELAMLEESTQQGVFISLCTPEGRTAVSLGTTFGRGSGITINDSEGQSCISLGVNHPENPHPPGPQPRIDVIDFQTRRSWNNWDGQWQVPPEPPA
jgi:hypothetical protein